MAAKTKSTAKSKAISKAKSKTAKPAVKAAKAAPKKAAAKTAPKKAVSKSPAKKATAQKVAKAGKAKSATSKASQAKKANNAKVANVKVANAKVATKPSTAGKATSGAKSKSGGVKAHLAPVKTIKLDWTQFITPLDDRVLVLVEAAPTKTAGGLFIPDSGSETPNRGKIVAVGRGRRDKKGKVHPLDVQLGDRVVYSSYSGNKIEHLGSEALLIKESEILGVIVR